MPLPVYATTEQLETFLGYGEEDTLPAKAGRWLVLASTLVRAATVTAVYDVDEDGAPTDTDVADAFANATCAQVSAWIDLGVDPTAGRAAVTGSAASSGIGTAKVEFTKRAGADDDLVATVDNLVPEAMTYLGDLEHVVTVWG
jgi:hypothetical protein